MIPLASLSALPWRYIGAALALAGALAALAWAVDGILDQERAAGRAEVRAQWDAARAASAETALQIERSIVETHAGIVAGIRARDEKIIASGREITVRLEQEVADDPRYRSDECRLGDGVLRELNAARRLDAAASRAGGADAAVPGAGVAAGR